jgi:hypothetical protein
MSRSKKYPIWKDQADKETKRLSNKRFRQAERQALHHGEEPPVNPKELFNQYDISDYRFWPRNEEDKKAASRK